MEDKIKSFVEYNGGSYVKIDDDKSRERIEALLYENTMFEPTNDIEMLYIGWYYRNIKRDIELAIKFYTDSANNDNPNALLNLAFIHKNVDDFKDKNLVIDYLSKAIEMNMPRAMRELARFYQEEQNYDMMKKYLLMACNYGCDISFNELVKYYSNNSNENVIDNFFLEFINLENFQDKMPSVFKFFKNVYSQKIDLIKLHFEYSLEGKGFDEAKKDFDYHMCKKN